MRLFNTKTLTLTGFLSEVPPYVALSHTWEDEEVVLHDLANLEQARFKGGFKKIELACRQARLRGFDYIWIDTICIDNTSSAEISEAINSMWTWFHDAAVCFVYMTDVVSRETLSEARWFTRGWTLLELLAPPACEFYDSEWTQIGDRTSLEATISTITGIDLVYLNDPRASLSASISTKMQWLSGRHTTRQEDIAYCSVCLFDITLLPIYGEGTNAFLRLQEEILTRSNDADIFKWYWRRDLEDTWTSVFAPSPDFYLPDDANAILCTADPRWMRNAQGTKPLLVRNALDELGLLQNSGNVTLAPNKTKDMIPPNTAKVKAAGEPEAEKLGGGYGSESDIDSIFSHGVSSVTSFTSAGIGPNRTIGIRQVTQTLLGHETLHTLFSSAVFNVEPGKSRAHIKGFLKEYGRNLYREASHPVEVQAAKFAQQLAGRLADEIRLAINPPNDESISAEKEPEKRDLENWLVSVANTGNPQRQATFGTEAEPNDDVEMDENNSEEEPDEPAAFPKIEQVREFLLSSEAFNSLIQALRAWLKVDDIAAGEKSSEDISATKLKEPEILEQKDVASTDPSDDACSMQTADEGEPGQEQASSHVVPPDPQQPPMPTANIYSPSNTLTRGTERIGATNWQGRAKTYQYSRNIQDLLSGIVDFWGISFFLYDLLELLMPSVPARFVRIRWRCSCGTVLWGDFPTTDPVALDMLTSDLWGIMHGDSQSVLGPPVSQSNGAFDNFTSGMSHHGSVAPTGMTGQVGMQPYPPISHGPSPRSGYDPSSQTESHTVNIFQGKPKYFEVCVNTANHAIGHYELDISTIRSDSELFELIWDRYNASRGIGIKRLLLRPRDVHFVLFSVSTRNEYGAGIHKEPREFPPEEEVEEKRYHYLSPKIIMPSNVFLHYLHRARWRVWGEHDEDLWLQRLPKKLNESLLAGASKQSDSDLRFGWGVHIINGPNHAVLGFLLAFGILITLLISTLIVGLAHTQEQAFGVGSYLIAIVACVMTSIYFKLADQ